MDTSTIVDRQPEAAPPDVGCAYAPKCAECWLARCVLELSGVEARKLGDALRVVKLFARADLMPG